MNEMHIYMDDMEWKWKAVVICNKMKYMMHIYITPNLNVTLSSILQKEKIHTQKKLIMQEKVLAFPFKTKHHPRKTLIQQQQNNQKY